MSKKHQKLLETLKLCAEKAGIEDRQFLAFGSLLGSVRPTLRRTPEGIPYYKRGQIPWDHDSDVGFLPIHWERKDAYFNYCREAGLFSHWEYPAHRIRRRQDNDEIVWFSTKLNKKRCCQWFFFEHKKYMFHSKGKAWLAEKKFHHADYPRKEGVHAIALGAPLKYFDGLVPFEFEGVPMNAPAKSGSLLDFWYPGWGMPKQGGASRKDIVMLIRDWSRPETWKLY
jgi:hypothetical protein